MRADFIFFMVRAEFILFTAILTALYIAQIPPAGGIDPDEVSFSPLVGVNQDF